MDREIVRSLVVCLAVLIAPAASLAQDSDTKAGKRRENRPVSVSAGMGFLESVGSPGGSAQFLLQFDGLYNFTSNLAGGITLQAGPSSRSSTVAMTFDGRFYLPIAGFTGNDSGIVSQLVPYVGAGIGFRTYTSDNNFPFNYPGTTDFLFSPILGLEYDITDVISVSTDMRFNVTSGPDNFYYSWQILGFRFRF